MRKTWPAVFCIVALGLIFVGPLSAQDRHDVDLFHNGHHARIKSFSVDVPDIPLSSPSYLTGVDFPDEHTSFLSLWPWSGPWTERDHPKYLLFTTSAVAPTGASGAVTLESNDLIHFDPAIDLGYSEQSLTSPVVFGTCDGTHDHEFDENYAGPGSVVQDPTLPPGNLIMLYEAENHCPGGIHQTNFYATVGFARSSDNGRTWPQPVNSEFGDASRHPVLKISTPEPATTFPVALGDAIPAGFVDINDKGDAYLYVTYSYHDGSTGTSAISIRMARAKLGGVFHGFDEHGWGFGRPDIASPPLEFHKWYNGSFSQSGIGGLDSAVLPSTSCLGVTRMSDLTYNDDLGLYMLIFVCNPSAVVDGTPYGAWYYSTATSLELQDWTTPQQITNSQQVFTMPCPDKIGAIFDGFYPSFMSPGAPAGHTGLTGRAFFLDGCDQGQPRALGSRTFTITTEP